MLNTIFDEAEIIFFILSWVLTDALKKPQSLKNSIVIYLPVLLLKSNRLYSDSSGGPDVTCKKG